MTWVDGVGLYVCTYLCYCLYIIYQAGPAMLYEGVAAPADTALDSHHRLPIVKLSGRYNRKPDSTLESHHRLPTVIPNRTTRKSSTIPRPSHPRSPPLHHQPNCLFHLSPSPHPLPRFPAVPPSRSSKATIAPPKPRPYPLH